jgi:protein NirF
MSVAPGPDSLFTVMPFPLKKRSRISRAWTAAGEVERESSSLAVIENGIKYSTMDNMHNMNHGVVKFDGKDGYVISRDGFVIKFDPVKEKIVAEYKTSKSAIGFVIGQYYVAVANYDDKSVDILDRDLNPIKKIVTIQHLAK